MTLNAGFTDQANLITLTTGPTRYTGSVIVSAPLPETFGVDIQSQMTQPFASFIPQGLIQTAVALKSISANAGIGIGKFYTGTESPDISFDMNFVAQYDALTEVVIPVAKLYVMATSYRVPLADVAAKAISDIFNTLAGLGTEAANGISDLVHILKPNIPELNATAPKLSAAEIQKFLYWLHGPPPLHCYFGNIYALGGGDNPITLSGMSPRFSNNIDYNGLPMQCTVSVTLTMKQPYFAETVAHTYASGYKIANVRQKLRH